MSDQVGGNHYRNKAIEPIRYVMENKLGYCEGNVIKYVTRHREKGGAQDIKKAIQYLHFILEHQYGEKQFSPSYKFAADAAFTDCFNAVSDIMGDPMTRCMPEKQREGAIAICEDIMEEINRRRANMVGEK